MARLLIRAAWVFLVAAFAAYVIIAWSAKAPHEFAESVAPWSSPGRMVRRNPDRTANRTTGIRRPRPSALRPSVHTSQSP